MVEAIVKVLSGFYVGFDMIMKPVEDNARDERGNSYYCPLHFNYK